MTVAPMRLEPAAPAIAPAATLSSLLGSFILAAMVLHPTLLWPLIEAPAPPPSAMADFIPAAPDQQSGPLNRLYFPAMLLFSLLAFALNRAGRLSSFATVSLALLIANLGWALYSTTWSVEPGITLRRGLMLTIIAAAVALAANACGAWRRGFNAIFLALALVAALNLVALVIKPPTPLGHAGIYPHKNVLGGVAACILMVSLSRAAQGPFVLRVLGAGTALVAMLLLVVSNSKTSIGLGILAPVVGLTLVAITRGARLTPALSIPAGVFALGGLYAMGAGLRLWDFGAVAKTLFGDPTLTQRTDIWAFAMQKIAQAPWRGYGYEAFWGAGFNSPSLREGPGFVAKMPQGHNGYIDLLLAGGIPAAALFAFLLFAVMAGIGRLVARDAVAGWLALTLFVFMLGYNMFETAYMRGFSLFSLMFLIVMALVSWTPRAGGR
ncbi:MAG: O-antigen ligase family protein [Pseudomonadota bacterium]